MDDYSFNKYFFNGFAIGMIIYLATQFDLKHTIIKFFIGIFFIIAAISIIVFV